MVSCLWISNLSRERSFVSGKVTWPLVGVPIRQKVVVRSNRGLSADKSLYWRTTDLSAGSSNNLTKLPADFGGLTELRNLDLSGNALDFLPDSFKQL
jgi:hypothetical protein